MTLDWILSPVTQYCVVVFGFLSCMGLCFATSIRMRMERRQMAQSQESLDQNVALLSSTVEQMRREAAEPERSMSAPAEGLTLTKRAQALRMHRRGESVATISAALQSPRNEIELMLKVHEYLNS